MQSATSPDGRSIVRKPKSSTTEDVRGAEWVHSSTSTADDDPAPRAEPDSKAETPPSDNSANPGRVHAGPRGWLNTLETLADKLPFVGGGSPSSGTTAAPAGATAAASAPLKAVKDVSFSTNEGQACLSSDRQFILNDIPDLYACVVFAGLTGKHVAQVTFVLPDGNVYQTMTVPFLTVDTPATVDPMVEVEGKKLQAKPAGWGADGRSMVTVMLPVAGTFITQYQLIGLWTVRVTLDGETVDQDTFDLVQQ